MIPCVYDEEQSGNKFVYDMLVLKKDGKFGIVDINGNVVLPFEYANKISILTHELFTMSALGWRKSVYTMAGQLIANSDITHYYPNNNLILLCEIQSWYELIDTSGQKVLERRYPHLELGEGIIVFADDRDGKTWYGGIMELSGRIIKEALYESYVPGIEYGCVVVVSSGKWGCIDTRGNVVIPLIYEYVEPLSQSLFHVRTGEKIGIVNRDNRTIVPIEYDEINKYGSYFVVGIGDTYSRLYGIIDFTGHIILPCIYTSYKNIYSAEEFDILRFTSSKDGDVAYRSDSGLLSHNKYDRIIGYSEGLIKIRENGLYGFMDEYLNEVIPCQFSSASPFNEGHSLVHLDRDDKDAVINKKGDIVIADDWEYAHSFSGGMALVKKNGKYGYINRTGEYTIPCIYDSACDFCGGRAVVGDRINGVTYYGYIDLKGRHITDCVFSSAESFKDGRAKVTAGQQSGYVDYWGNCTFETRHFASSQNSINSNTLIAIVRDAKDSSLRIVTRNISTPPNYTDNDLRQFFSYTESPYYHDSLGDAYTSSCKYIEDGKEITDRSKRLRALSMEYTTEILRQDYDVVAVSHRNGGWTGYDWSFNDDIKFHVYSNFGYGSASDFNVTIVYKGICLTPISYYVRYRYMTVATVLHCTRRYSLNYTEWGNVMRDSLKFFEDIQSGKEDFVCHWFDNELSEMIEGLELLAKDPTYHTFMDRPLSYIKNDPDDMILGQSDKISNAMEFVDVILKLCESFDFGYYLSRLRSVCHEFIPKQEEEIKRLEKEVNEKKHEIEELSCQGDYPLYIRLKEWHKRDRYRIWHLMHILARLEPDYDIREVRNRVDALSDLIDIIDEKESILGSKEYLLRRIINNQKALKSSLDLSEDSSTELDSVPNSD